jgi:hypothetical protein
MGCCHARSNSCAGYNVQVAQSHTESRNIYFDGVFILMYMQLGAFLQLIRHYPQEGMQILIHDGRSSMTRCLLGDLGEG